MKKLAIFDIDGTIFRSSLIIDLVNGLVKNKVFSNKILKEVEKDYKAWINRRGDYIDYINNVVISYRKYLKGCKEEDVLKTIKEVVANQKDKTYVFPRELIKKLKNQKYFLVAISGSPEIIVSEFANVLGFDSFFGSKYEVKNKKFTGKTINDIAWKKDEILNHFIKENKLNLKGSIGVGDSEIDISFLELVDNPIAFNPDLKLADYAKSKKWNIIVERKNVVYKIKDFSFEITS